MKRISIFLLFLLSSIAINAQDRNNEDQVVKVDAQASRFNSAPGELLVKFRSGTNAQLRSASPNKVVSAVKAIDGILSQYALDEVEQLLPNDNPKRVLRSAKAYSGQEIKETSLNQLYRLRVSASSAKNSYQLMEELKASPEVEFAEPNYLVYTLGEPTQEPMYSLQWGIPAVKLNTLWQKPVTNSKRRVIAIIDTGVDTEHPDLAANIWTNAAEASGIDNYDNDGNGFKNDIHGWDFVNNTSNVRDNNSHGTHCAGIAAAVGTNGVGITGADPNALIMPLTALQSNGTGDIATIIKAINYAAQNGADIISMSFGTYAYSIALEQALAQAYQSCVLVGAAGNDGLPLYPGCVFPPIGGPMFPAAFTFVLGVQATQQGGGLCAWSNYDCSGPIYSEYPEEQLYNYELQAPGEGIISTVPGGSYRAYNGTSMAAPLVAGGIAALLDRKEFASQEMLWATLIQSASNTTVDFNAAYSYTPSPMLNVVAIETNDTLKGDGDMRPDAGELIEIYPTLKNAGGTVSDIHFKVEFAEFEDQTTATILNGDTDFGYTLTPYSKMKAANPVQIQISPNVVDGRIIKLVLKAWYGNHEGEISQELVLNVENGVELKGILTQDMTLYPNTQYIVTDNFAIPTGVKLTILPGTIIKIKDNKSIGSSGQIYAVGKPDSLIVFTKGDLDSGNGSILFSNSDTLEYCKIENIQPKIMQVSTELSNCIIVNNNILGGIYPVYNNLALNKSNFFYNNMGFDSGTNGWFSFSTSQYYNNVIDNVTLRGFFTSYNNIFTAYMPQSNIFSNTPYNIEATNTTFSIFQTDRPCYWGSSIESIVRKGIWDFYTPNSGCFGTIDLSNMATRPYAEAHGIVWKVVVNGYDAQDEFDQLPPLGVGKQKFEVYFNRPMNKSVTPMVAMGVRPPYTQNAIAEDGSWNDAGDIYTAYYTVKAASATDGLNRIYVANAQDNEFFDIPFENQRFNVVVQSAGSLSTGFEATPGLGKVDLEWEAPEGYFDDLMGYNMYRYTYDAATETYSDTVQINQALLIDPEYTDFDVVPGKTYNYMYKVLRTSLTENDFSRAVSATPFTAAKGDSNGDLNINVVDVVTTVNYIMGQDPKPFIFDAADVNSDSAVDVLDVVGTVNLIFNPQAAPAMRASSAAIYSVENGILYVESPVALGGVQFKIKADKNLTSINTLEALNGFEQASGWLNDDTYLLLAYSMSGKEIAAGKQALLQIGKNAVIDQVILSDTHGNNVIAVNNSSTNLVKIEGNQLLKIFPNPFKETLNITTTIGFNTNTKVDIVFTDLTGREIDRISGVSVQSGTYHYVWNPRKLHSGIYFCTLRINGRAIQTEKVVCNP